MLKTGMIIAERYEILAKIGTGGMADVYKANDHKLNRSVAVKVLKPEFREDTTFIRKFRSEAQAAAGLTHPNIVNVFDVGDDEGVHYIVMELIEGITLKEYIGKKGKLSIKEATSIGIQVSMGLEAAHNHGIVHRDVKPQNISISTDGKVKVTDFGIARAASSNTISSNVMGSVHYSSPEQVRGGYCDEKSDIYSLGITLYEMVTGRVPFDGDTTVAIAIKHLQEEMVPPSIYSEDLPNSLEQIIIKCTQKSVGRRYEKMEDVIADLKHSLIDPQGNFVKLTNVNTAAKTVVISDAELGEIKHNKQSVKNKTSQKKPEIAQLEEEVYETDYDDTEEERERQKRRRAAAAEKRRRQQSRRLGRVVSVIALLLGAVILVGVIFFIGKAAGLIGEQPVQEQPQIEVPVQPEDDGLVDVPNLVGKTEDEARALLDTMSLGMQFAGEEASTQEKGRISSQDIVSGSKVQANTTIKYYLSKGTQQVNIPDISGYTGVEAQEQLESLGLIVSVQKEYSEMDWDGYPIVYPGYAYYTMPEAGTSVRSGDAVTLVVSRGNDHGNSSEVPGVVGMQEDDAVTSLGKWLDIQVVYEKNPEIMAGEVISQSPEAYTYADPNGSITITVSSGNQDPVVAVPDAAMNQTPAVNSSEIWKCTQSLNTPAGYAGGLLRMELIQDVNGQQITSTVVDGQQVAFPYQLDITGASGVGTGMIYLYEQKDGVYQQLGYYTLTFKKAE